MIEVNTYGNQEPEITYRKSLAGGHTLLLFALFVDPELEKPAHANLLLVA
jgi:hypothetical protein